MNCARTTFLQFLQLQPFVSFNVRFSCEQSGLIKQRSLSELDAHHGMSALIAPLQVHCSLSVQFEFVVPVCWDTETFFSYLFHPDSIVVWPRTWYIYPVSEVKGNLSFGSVSIACHQESLFQRASMSEWKQAAQLDSDSDWLTDRLKASSPIASHAKTSGMLAVYTFLSWHFWKPTCARLMNSAVLVEHFSVCGSAPNCPPALFLG